MKKLTGIELITQERKDQIEKHKFSLLHDQNEYKDHGDTLGGAMLYLLTGEDKYYPSNWEQYWKDRFSEKTDIEKLAIVGALAAAKIDLLQNPLR